MAEDDKNRDCLGAALCAIAYHAHRLDDSLLEAAGVPVLPLPTAAEMLLDRSIVRSGPRVGLLTWGFSTINEFLIRPGTYSRGSGAETAAALLANELNVPLEPGRERDSLEILDDGKLLRGKDANTVSDRQATAATSAAEPAGHPVDTAEPVESEPGPAPPDGGAEDCIIVARSSESCFYPNGNQHAAWPHTRVTAKILTNRNLSTMAAAMDPRNWSRCISCLFRESYTVQSKPAPGNPKTPFSQMAYLHPTPEPDDYVDFPEHTIPAPIGKPWNGLMYEEFHSVPMRFRNLLHIDFSVEDDAEQVPANGQGSDVARPSAGPLSNQAIQRICIRYEQTRNETVYNSFRQFRWRELLNFNHGSLVAERKTVTVSGGASPSQDPVDTQLQLTEIVGQKFVGLGDATHGSSGLNDFGLLLRYLSPAILSLWTQAPCSFGVCCKPEEDC